MHDRMSLRRGNIYLMTKHYKVLLIQNKMLVSRESIRMVIVMVDYEEMPLGGEAFTDSPNNEMLMNAGRQR